MRFDDNEVTILRASGVVELPAIGRPTLAQAQKFVGGYIEYIAGAHSKNRQVWANEDGLALGLPVNKLASEAFGLTLVGDVLVLTGDRRLK